MNIVRCDIWLILRGCYNCDHWGKTIPRQHCNLLNVHSVLANLLWYRLTKYPQHIVTKKSTVGQYAPHGYGARGPHGASCPIRGASCPHGGFLPRQRGHHAPPEGVFLPHSRYRLKKDKLFLFRFQIWIEFSSIYLFCPVDPIWLWTWLLFSSQSEWNWQEQVVKRYVYIDICSEKMK